MSRGLISLAIAVALVIGSALLVLQIKNNGTLFEIKIDGTGTEELPVGNDVVKMTPRCENDDRTNLWRIDTSPPTFLFGTISLVEFENIIEFVSSNAKSAFFSSDEIFFPSTKEQRKKTPVHAKKYNGKKIKDIISPDLYGRLVGKIFEFSQDDLHARALLMTMNQVEATGFMIYFGELADQITKENRTKFDLQNLKTPRTLQRGLETWAKEINKTVRPLRNPKEIGLPARFLEFLVTEVLEQLEPEYTDTETAKIDFMIQKYKCAEFNATNWIYNSLFRFDSSDERLEAVEALNKWWTEDKNAENKVLSEKIKEILMSNDGKRRFIAVDISHLAGPFGTIIDLLEIEGFKIQRVRTTEPLSKLLF